MSKYVTFNDSISSQNGGSLIDNIKSKITNNIFIILIVVALIIGVYYYYVNYISPSLKPNFKPNSEHIEIDDNNKKMAEMMFFYVDWCPHCKTAKPDWNDLKAEYENKTINGYKVIFTEVNCTNETAEVEQLMDKYKIEGFPTIKLIKDGEVVEYDAKPSKETMEQFLNTVL
jgi:thiol-disulfide isomerase/thioredoxin